MKTFFCNKIVVLLLAFFAPANLNIGGEVSPSFLFILATFPLWHKYLSVRKDKNLSYILRAFVILIITQIIWALFAETSILDQVKGISIVVSGLFIFMYYYMIYQNDRELVKWAVLGTFLSSFFFINVLVEMEGTYFGMWKFQIMPRLVTLCALIYLWGINKKKLIKVAPILFIGIGCLGVATGARSVGLVPLLAGFLTLILQFKRKVRIKSYILLFIVLAYAAFATLYVPNVLNGRIKGGNTEQLMHVENPYNPINLLMFGRGTSIIPFMAFIDRPITGWGYLTPDPHGKYHKIALNLQSEEEYGVFRYEKEDPIPRHSGWGYIACSYGLIGFLSIFFILKRSLSVLFSSLVAKDKYLLYRIFIALGFLWDLIFSPLAHFKYNTSALAIIIIFSVAALKEYHSPAAKMK